MNKTEKKNLNLYLTEEDTWMPDKYIKWCSKSLIFKELQLRTTMICQCKTIIMNNKQQHRWYSKPTSGQKKPDYSTHYMFPFIWHFRKDRKSRVTESRAVISWVRVGKADGEGAWRSLWERWTSCVSWLGAVAHEYIHWSKLITLYT